MIVTPEEARTKHCVNETTATCIADRCMGWVTFYKYETVKDTNNPSRFPKPPSLIHKKVETGLGYCGLVYK